MVSAIMGKGALLFMLTCGATAAGEGNESCSDSSLSARGINFIQSKNVLDRVNIVEPEDPVPGKQSICGAGEEILDVDCLKPSNMALQISQSKATLMMGLGCTAWIVKLPTGSQGARVLTAGHCGRNDPETFYFDYNTPCGRKDSHAVRGARCQGSRLAREETDDDYTLYELDPACQHVAGITPFLLDVGEPQRDEGMYLIGHPNRRPKKISFQEVHDDGHHCEVRSFFMRSSRSKRVRYYCDTQGGNSGSPVISSRTGYAFAIHSHGGCNRGQTSANSGSLLKNSVGVLRQFGIPFVDRSTTDILQQIHFTKKTVCPVSETQISLRDKKLDECRTTCMNALKCVGFAHSGSGTDCTVVYEVRQGQSKACPGSSAFYERVYGATTPPPSPRPTPPPAIPTPSPIPSCSDTDNRCATKWKGKCSRKGVQKRCPQSCNTCGTPGECKDKSSKCQKLKNKCSKRKVKARCPLTCGVCSNSGS
mmetsp:Transcript_70893/g.136762  ORF Transcript_70893/g.136762 Transcript_70893/m.136762 type:complete len:479 (+) Transcript_70893:33-1469(+)